MAASTKGNDYDRKGRDREKLMEKSEGLRRYLCEFSGIRFAQAEAHLQFQWIL